MRKASYFALIPDFLPIKSNHFQYLNMKAGFRIAVFDGIAGEGGTGGVYKGEKEGGWVIKSVINSHTAL